jgi:hypothetical protein
MEYEYGEQAFRLDSDAMKSLGITIPNFVGNNPLVLKHSELETVSR